VYTRLADTQKAAGLLAVLDAQGIDPNLAQGVVGQYFETRLRLTDTGEAAAEARAQFEKVAAQVAETPTTRP
jgi:hypothetical protein